MKARYYFLIIGFILVLLSNAEAVSNQPVNKRVTKIEVNYFHFSRRCETCKAVEAETLKSIQTLYPNEFKSGLVSFKSINLDDNESKIIAERCSADGQSLLIISGKKRLDITDLAFMYAKNNPAKFRFKLKNSIDPLLK